MSVLLRNVSRSAVVVALASLVACATGPGAGGETAPAPIVMSPTLAPVLVSPADAPPLAQAAPTVAAPAPAQTSAWQLADLTTVHAGTVSDLPDGTLVSNYVLTGAASAIEGTIVTKGVFQLVLSAFWPRRDLPGQPTGKWYINASWSITAPDATPLGRPRRERSGVIQGTVVTTLDANPTSSGEALTLPAQVPISRVDGVWTQGRGDLAIDADRGAGTLTLVLDRRAP